MRPLAGPLLQGLSATALWDARPWLELSLGIAALSAPRIQQGDVVAEPSIVPLDAAVHARWTRAGVELLAGPNATVALSTVSVTSATTGVHSSRDMILALGGEAEGRVRLGASLFAFLRPTAQAVLLGPRYSIDGQPVLDTARLALAVSAGVGLGGR